MGSLSDIAGMLPGVNPAALDDASFDGAALGRTEAIILSMTPQERENPSLLNSSRKKRIAAGCGMQVVDVNRMLKQFELMQQVAKQMSRQMGGGKRKMGGLFGKAKGRKMPGFPF